MWFNVVSVVFRPGRGETMPEVADVIRSVFDLYTEFIDRAIGVLIIEDRIVGKKAPWDFRNITSQGERGLSVWQRVVELSWTPSLLVLSGALSVQQLLENMFSAIASADDNETSLVSLKENYAAEKEEL